MQNLPAMDVEADEIWGFIGCKEKTKLRKHKGEEFGDCYTFFWRSSGIPSWCSPTTSESVGPVATVRFSEALRRGGPWTLPAYHGERLWAIQVGYPRRLRRPSGLRPFEYTAANRQVGQPAIRPPA